MAQVTLKKLLEPVNKNNPCGENLADLSDYYILKEMLNGKEETQWSAYEPPDWKNIFRMAKGLLLKGKDLWVTVILVYASTELHGIEGMHNGLEFLRDIIAEFWDDIQPELFPEDEDDFTLSRLSPLATMSSEKEHLCRSLKAIPFIETKRCGKFSYNDIKIITDDTAVRSERLEKIEVAHIADDLKRENFDETVGKLEDCISICREINNFITEKVGQKNNVANMEQLITFMDDMLKLFSETLNLELEKNIIVEDNKVESEAKSSEAATSVKNTVSSNGQIVSEQDVLRLLKDICKWYELNLSMSPVPLILNKAINLVGKSFMETLEALMEDKASEIQAVLNTNIRFLSKDGKTPVDTVVTEQGKSSNSSESDENLISAEKPSGEDFTATEQLF